jgi:hypothetical protein
VLRLNEALKKRQLCPSLEALFYFASIQPISIMSLLLDLSITYFKELLSYHSLKTKIFHQITQDLSKTF